MCSRRIPDAPRSRSLPKGVDLVLLDYRLPDTDGVTVLRKIKEFDQDILVILLTAYASVETAVEAMKLGAYHFANKPFNLDEVAATVERALETTRLRREVRQFRTNAARPYSLQRIVGASPAVTTLRHLVARVAVHPVIHRLAHRREWHGQGPGRQDHPLLERPCLQAVHEHHVFGPARAVARKRAVRPRTRRVHRCPDAEEGVARDGGWRHGVSRRDRRDDARRFRRSCCGSWKRRASSEWAAPWTSGSTSG